MTWREHRRPLTSSRLGLRMQHYNVTPPYTLTYM